MFKTRLKLRVKKRFSDQRGNILLIVLIFGFVSFSLIITGVAGFAISENHASIRKHNQEMALQIAEAGINYYRWHLAHNKTDYQDGTGVAGPYVHEYKDKNGNVVGYFSLNIIPPVGGSTVVAIESTGWRSSQTESKRTIRVRLGFPTVTNHTFVSNAGIWVGNNEIIHGKIHTNSGLRFDGLADALVTSAVTSYICKEHIGCGNQEKPGIWGSGGPTEYWKFPVPAIDFDEVTATLADVKDGAQNGGLYLSSSGQQGWWLEFLANGTVNVSKVLTTKCYKGRDFGSDDYEWYCVDINTEGTVVNYSLPGNGYIFVEDMVWVDGVVSGRVTVGTAASKSVIINNNITYLAKDGNYVLGLIGEEDVIIPHDSPEYLEIDAAVLAQKGSAKRYYYSGDKKEKLTIYGSVTTNKLKTWSWISGGGAVTSGYKIIESTYDVNLTYNPPLSFPVGSEYNLLSWEEIASQ